MNNNNSIIGIDLGGTNIRGGVVTDFKLSNIISKKINAQGSADEVLKEVFSLTDQLINNSVKSIGIGVPGLINAEEKMVYDVVYIPSWKKVPLQKWMEDRYHIPVFINNDANCFALGEFYFGKVKGTNSIVGLTIGTGLGCGLIINKKLYEGRNGGAGEFGMISYLDKTVEYYASGQFFQNVYNTDGESVFKNAKEGNTEALKMYQEMGTHLGNAVKTILYALDVELIVLGGSVRHAFPYFSKTMWDQIKTFGFQNAITNLRIEVSEIQNAGMLGAAALYYDSEK
ncbi:MAG TPA: ROK family protein [Hanamia sp.]|nr:ROK family protein [Hanamia sp.]